MSNLFSSLGRGQGSPVQNGANMGQPQQPMNIFQMYKQFRQNFTGDPNAILQQKIQTGEVSPEVVEQAKQILGQIKR